MWEKRLTGHPLRGMYLLTRMPAASSAVKRGRGNGVHVSAPAEAVGEKENAGVSFGRNR